ncbi:AI-2E family transporter [Qiania dongpingensis]|uniref:AI-2E family transporter n=1 Tax=Qiania dongpingensis TaxID=2763669 RepID=A0A7G9G0S0_9FIRM|nr:AI-2E family transporter [Qiania dongpingensis]QNM04402.1 AI-2E family transporter [Qiania dongpingensis]
MGQDGRGRKLSEKQKKALLVTGITAAVYISFKYLLPLVIPFLTAYWVALLVRPGSRWLHKKLRLKEGIWASLLVTVFSALLLAAVYFLGRLFLEQLFMAVRRLPVYTRYLCGWLDDLCCRCDDSLGFAKGTSLEFIYTQCENIMNRMGDMAGVYVMDNSMAVLKWVIKGGAFLAIVSIGSVLMVSSMDRIRRYRNISVFRQEITTVTGCLSRVGKAFFRTQILIMGLTCLVCGTGLYLLGNNYAVLLGVLIGLLDALPVFGTGTVLIPWAIFSVLLGNWAYAVGLTAIYAICYFLREVMEAKMMGGHMGIPPLEMLMSMYIGLMLFGVAGFILGPFGFMVIKELTEMYGGKGIKA